MSTALLRVLFVLRAALVGTMSTAFLKTKIAVPPADTPPSSIPFLLDARQLDQLADIRHILDTASELKESKETVLADAFFAQLERRVRDAGVYPCWHGVHERQVAVSREECEAAPYTTNNCVWKEGNMPGAGMCWPKVLFES